MGAIIGRNIVSATGASRGTGLRIVRNPTPDEAAAQRDVIAHPADVPIVVATMKAQVDFLVTFNMKTIRIAWKTLLELWREPQLWILMLVFPILLLAFFYLAFGGTNQGAGGRLTLWVVNEDQGGSAEGQFWQLGEQLIDEMRTLDVEGLPELDVVVVTGRREAEISLRERKVSLLFTLPPDFTQTLLDAWYGVARVSPAVVTLTGDLNSGQFVFARSLLDEWLRQFANYALGWPDDVLTVEYQSLSGSDTISDFEFGVPAAIVFGAMLIVVTTAQSLVRENVGGTLRRLRLTRLTAMDLLLGVTLAQMAVAVVQVPLVFGVAILMGFRGQGSLLLAMGVTLLLSFSAVGVGLVVACFARNDGEAANLGGIAGVMMVLMSDAMYPMPDAPLATIAGRTVQVYDLLPTSHAAEAMRQVLILGKGLDAIGYELAGIVLTSALLLGVGVGVYQRLQLRKA